MTDQEIVERTNQLAREFYAQHGYNARLGFRFDLSAHPQERTMWRCACAVMQMLLDTDPDDALTNLEDDADSSLTDSEKA